MFEEITQRLSVVKHPPSKWLPSLPGTLKSSGSKLPRRAHPRKSLPLAAVSLHPKPPQVLNQNWKLCQHPEKPSSQRQRSGAQLIQADPARGPPPGSWWRRYEGMIRSGSRNQAMSAEGSTSMCLVQGMQACCP